MNSIVLFFLSTREKDETLNSNTQKVQQVQIFFKQLINKENLFIVIFSVHVCVYTSNNSVKW